METRAKNMIWSLFSVWWEIVVQLSISILLKHRKRSASLEKPKHRTIVTYVNWRFIAHYFCVCNEDEDGYEVDEEKDERKDSNESIKNIESLAEYRTNSNIRSLE